MIPRSNRTCIALSSALAVPISLSLGLLAVPGVISVSAYATLAALLLGVAAVTLISARNASPTGSLGQLLYETEHPVPAPVKRSTPRSSTW